MVVTVTSAAEAALAARAGADALGAQGHEAGAHRGTYVNDDAPGRDSGLLSLIAEVAAVTRPAVVGPPAIGATTIRRRSRSSSPSRAGEGDVIGSRAYSSSNVSTTG